MQNKSFLTRLLVCLFALLPLTAVAEETTQLAKWTFDTGYTVTDNVYTPNTEDWAEIGWNGFGTLPQILPNEFTGNQSDYYVSAKGTRFWGIMTNYDAKIMSLYQDMDPNNISDYTDASQHNQYFEIGFPTTGYKNVQFSFAFTCGDNAVRSLEMVVSTDGGQTWNDAGAYEGAANWWIYNTSNVTLSANNKEKVIVRLITPNDATAQWRMNEISISAEEAEGPVAIDEKDFTAMWPLKDATIQTAATTSKDGLFSVAEMSWGDKLTPTSLRTDAGVTRQQFQPNEQVGGQDEGAAIIFAMKPKKALTFTPKKLSFNASKVGTNGGAFDVVVVSGDQSYTLGTGINPQLAKESPYVSNHEFDLSNIPATDDMLYAKIYVYNLATNKQYAFSDVTITGDVQGSIEAVPTYTLNVTLGTEGAGKVSSNPAGSEFDEGTQITVTATENFGYHFANWTDAEGNVVSENATCSFEISANTVLTANYTKTDVYALNMEIEGDANDYMISFQPEGNVVNGVHHYEAGTDVKVFASSNKILTFTQWEDGTTNPERTIHIDADKDLKATYSAADYIVGWDFVNADPKQGRRGDFVSNTENAGSFTLEKPDGTAKGWLAHANYDGKSCAINWSGLNDGYNFGASFKTIEYSNLKVYATLECHYNAHQNVIWQYSIDGGQTWTDFGQTTLQSASWQEQEFSLPEEVNNQPSVKIRWYEDLTSDVIGNSGNNGMSITDVFVTGDLQMIDDGKAPVLVSSNPEMNGTGASASGSIILNFDEKIKAGEGQARLAGENVTMTISGKAAMFAYSGLKYGTEYTFIVPAGLIVDRTGNAYEGLSLTFTTMERQQPAARLYDAVVDANVESGSKSAEGILQYKTVQEAIDAAPAGRGTPWLIFVKNGEYKEHVDIPKTKPYIHLIGQNRDKTIVKDNQLSGGPTAVHVSIGATVVVNADNCFFEDITLENTYGYEKQDGPQALALNTTGDRIAFNNVSLRSYQDTWITTSTSNNRHYIKNSLIIGAVDFIYNSGNVYLDTDTIEINRPSGGYIVAPSHAADVKWGYVFQNNILRAHPGVEVKDVWLGRPWHNQPKTVYINLQTFINIPAKGWYNTMGGLPALWAEYNTVDAKGNPVDLTQRETYYYTKNEDGSVKESVDNVKNTLTAEEAAQYTIKNVMGGNDNWQPDLMCEACEAPVVKETETGVEWEAVPYAICYVVTRGDEVLGFTTETSYAADAAAKALAAGEKQPIAVQAVNEFGGLSKLGVAGESTAISRTEAAAQMTIEGIYSADGSRLSAPQRGLNIVKYRDSNGKVLVKKIMY